MKTQTFEPGSQYLSKLRLVTTIVALLILLGGLLLGWLLSLDKDMEAGVPRMVIIVTVIIDAVWWAPGMLLTAPYYRSLSYEIQDDEVIVRVGIWTKSVKHVPYRTVTNLVVKRDILDRWFFGTGTLNIQTAGMSGTTGAEESLVGLLNVQQVYEIVVRELRRFRGGMAPNAAGMEVEPALISTDALNEILTEVRAIRQTLEKD
jgi:membrane protein YdbS with pleckstrin-like domain